MTSRSLPFHVSVGCLLGVAALTGCVPSFGPDADSSILVADAGSDQRIVAQVTTALVVLDGDATGGTGELDFTWTDEGGTELGSGEQINLALPPGDYVITLTVSDSAGRSDSDSVLLTIIDPDENFTLTINTIGSGTTDPPPGESIYSAGETVSVSAAAAEGWRFAGWSGDLNTTLSSTSLYMDNHKNVTAQFEPITVSSVPLFHVPFAPGEGRTVGQANNGQFSHQGKFAWDFTVPIGTPVLAGGGGRIVYVVENLPNNADGAVIEPDQPANVIVVDLGEGLLALYAHLDLAGAKPIAGQHVAAGQCLGRSGNSGYSTGPHLHYEVLDANQMSVSTGFIESDSPDGIATEGESLVSTNELDLSSSGNYVESSLPVDAFAENHVELTAPTPPAFFLQAGDAYTLRGSVNDGSNAVCVAMAEFDGTPTTLCDQTIEFVGPGGSFELDFTIPETLTGVYLWGMISGTNGVLGTVSVPVYVSPPQAANTVPEAVAEQPQDRAIACGAAGTLDGRDSIDGDGDALTYQWVQVTGPTATIEDAQDDRTFFTIDDGTDGARILFQVTVFDGQAWSLPAAVEFELDCQ